MHRYRLLAIDIDGTLVNSRNELSPGNRAALRRAMDNGLRVVLATGRRYSRTLPLVAPLALDVPLVTGTGALIKHPRDHQTLFCAQFPKGVLRQLLGVVSAAGFEAVLYGDTYSEGFDFYCSRCEGHRAELAEYLRLNPGCERIWPGLMSEPPGTVFAGFAIGTRQEMLSLEETLHKEFSGGEFLRGEFSSGELSGGIATHVIHSPFYSGWMCELLPQGVSKWSGILRVAGDWGIAAEEIVAIGDDVNDIPMLRGAGLGVAMGNAPIEVRSAADRVAPRVDDDGVAEVVRWVLE